MQPPDLPHDEKLRLKTLRQCGLLDTQPEERFDRLTRLAQQLFQCKIVLISLIDANRQWLKSKQGLDIVETSRDISFCGHTILSSELLLVGDATKDPRFQDNPLVVDTPYIRFYAGAPLHAPNGQRLGSLCLIDDQPRQLSEHEEKLLCELAACVEHEIANQQAQRQHDALLTLTRITSLSFEDPITLLRETLALGCQYLQLTTGVISHKLPDDRMEILVQHPETCDNLEGQIFPRSQTYSDLVSREHGVFSVEHVFASPYRLHPSYLQFKQETYIGIPLFMDGKRYGTLGFSDKVARANPYSGTEKEFINILGDWVNATLRRMELNRSLAMQELMNAAIAKAQTQFIKGKERSKGFDTLLEDMLRLTESAFGFVGEVLYDKLHAPYLKTYSITDIAWSQTSKDFVEKNLANGLEFTNTRTLFGQVLLTQEIVIANDVKNDPRSMGVPQGHPELNTFLGIPVHHDGKLLAMIGLANRKGGYSKELADFLQPMQITLGQLVNADRIQRQHEESEKRLANIIEGTNIGTWECHIPSGNAIFNERWAEMLGYTLEELSPTTTQTWLNLCHPDDLKIASRLLQQHFSGDVPYYDLTTRLRHKNGHWIWVRDRGCVVNWGEDGTPLLMSGSHQDVTQERLAEEKLAHAYELLEQSNAAARIGTWEYDLANQKLYWSKVTRQIHEVAPDFDCDKEQALNFYKKGRHRERIQALLHDAVTKGQKFDDEFKIITANGNERWVRVIGLAQFKDYQIHKLYGIFQDISTTKASEQAMQDQAAHTQAILDNVLDGIITVNHKGKIDAVNPAAANIFGYQRDELTGQHFSVLLPEHAQVTAHLFQGRALDEHAVLGAAKEIEARRKDGNVFPLDLSVSAVTRQGRPLYIGLMRDITERKRLDRIKSEFISTVSHELRTPLTSISGALGLLLGGATGTLPDSLTPLLNIASKNSQRLTYLIDDLLDMEKLSAGKMHFHIQQLALIPLLQQSVETNTTFGAQRQISLSINEPVPEVLISVDSQRFMQIISNLLSNAIKYSPQQETVTISTSLQNDYVRISVTDRGNGIPKEFRSRIFQKFAQADSSDTREKGGTGLGLAITRELVEHMGGQVGFESIPGQGATFYFELPYQLPAQIHAKTPTKV
ncbi:PAS domain S-box protein [Undibacterium sp. CY7W]|uniref:histidine kinase n=2 Tax=Undibacterium TaxID=401469 RepID=A0A923IBF5_9BURK|nr:PAS domain S-box protein [Undibacterium rugosum]MBC3936165.1 PAS domain S-box protein [Undibacterium rugosum]